MISNMYYFLLALYCHKLTRHRNPALWFKINLISVCAHKPAADFLPHSPKQVHAKNTRHPLKPC